MEQKGIIVVKPEWRNAYFLLAVAFIIRLIPVLYSANWTDLYVSQANPILRHLNIYSVTHRIFPYSPISMFLPALCAKIAINFKLPFHIVMRFPGMIADACIALVLYMTMAKIGIRNAFFWGLFYALNPVSILISSFHGNVITIAALFTFLAYVVLLFGVEKNYRLSALLLGFAIGFRHYPILLLPLFLIKLNLPPRKKLAYCLYAIIPTALSFIPFLILDYKSVLREVFAYSGFIDYGIAAIMRGILSFKNNTLMYTLPNNFHINLLSMSKIVFFIAYSIILFISAKKRLITSIIAIFLMFYALYAGISSQYFVWILPFAFLIKEKVLKYYLIVATWALVSFYWLYHPQIIFGKFPPIKGNLQNLLLSEIISLSVLWILCSFWALKLLIKKPVIKERSFI